MQTLCYKLGGNHNKHVTLKVKSQILHRIKQPHKVRLTDRQTELVELRLCLNNSASVLDHNGIKEAVMLLKYTSA